MRVAIVDDDGLICNSLEIILSAQDDIEVVGSVQGGHAAVALYCEQRPDVMLMDIQMPDLSGLDAARRILDDDPTARIVFLTTFSDDEYIVRALALGARGYLIKQDVATIAPALRAVMSGQSVLEGEVLARVAVLGARRVGGSAASSDGSAAGDDDPFSALTDREREVVRGIAAGLDNKEIAAAAYMGEGTVRNHISSILSKLNLKNRTQIAIAYWRRRGVGAEG